MFCLIPLCSAAVFTLYFIPLCSPITFLNAHCPESYCIHHLPNVFYFLSAKESISSSLLCLLLSWANCCSDFKSSWHHVRQRTELGKELLPHFVVHFSALNYSCWNASGHIEKKQNKTCIVGICWACQFSQKVGIVSCCKSGCSVFSSIILKHTDTPGCNFRNMYVVILLLSSRLGFLTELWE